MNCVLILVAVFVAGEILAVPLFRWIRRWLDRARGPYSAAAHTALIKGILERLFLVVGLTMGYPIVIVALGALKLGTRLKEDQESKVSNDFFLIGNLCSFLLAILYISIVRVVAGCPA